MQAARRRLLTLLGLLTIVAVAAQAGVVVINNLQVNGSYIGNPVKFEAGANAGAGKGINGTDITVQLSNNNADAVVTFKIPPGESYFVDVLRVKNYNTTTTYYYKLNALTLSGNVTAFKHIILIVATYDSINNQYNVLGSLDVINNTQTVSYFTLSPNSEHILIFAFQTNSGWQKNATIQMGIKLVYSTNADELIFPYP